MSEPREGCMIEYQDKFGNACRGYIHSLSKNTRSNGTIARFYWVVNFPWELALHASSKHAVVALIPCIPGHRVTWISEESVLE